MSHPPSPNGKIARERLDVLVVAQGLAPSRQRAQAIIMAGQIHVAGQVADKPGMRVPTDATIAIAGQSPELRYVSRGGLKLELALDTFHLDPTGLTALDIGASTGGFTDILLRRGATRVFAVDVGQGQLAWSLRTDPRVVTMERTNVRDLAQLIDNTLADCVVIDVSFISLRLVLPAAIRLARPGAWLVALVKPQFEAGKHEADRGGGVIRDPAVHRRVLRDLLGTIATQFPQLSPRGLIVSPITGRDGNHEYLLWLAITPDDATSAQIDVDGVVAAALETPPLSLDAQR